MIENKSWGTFTTLHKENTYQVNLIKLNSQQSSNKHYHKLSCEKYIIISGNATLYLDNEEIQLKPQNIAEIPINKSHHIKCTSDEDLVFIEVKIGSVFGPEDTYRD